MKTYLLVLLLLGTSLGAVVRTYVDEMGRQIDQHVGSYMLKDKSDTLYRVTYDVEMLGGNLITNLDEVKGIRKVQCDLTNIEMVIDFNSVPDAYSFYKDVKGEGFDKFLTSGKYNCSDVQAHSFMTLRRVVEAEINGVTVLLRTSQGTYEETIKEGSIKMEPAEEPEEHSKTFCFGVNANSECTAANSPLPLYHNDYVDLTCSNCFVGAKATVFLDFKISWFKVRHIGTGLRNIAINAAFILDLMAHASASGSIDKTFRLVDGGLVIQFWIGPVPVTIWYEIPLRLVASAMMDVQAHATAGAKATWNLGNAYVEWNEKHGWHVAKPDPKFTWEKVLSGDASFNAEASLAIIPSVIIHIMKIAQAGVRLEPSLMLKAEGNLQNKELCADLSYKIVADISAAIGMNLPLVKMFQKSFGPYEILNTGVKPIGHWCVKSRQQLTE